MDFQNVTTFINECYNQTTGTASDIYDQAVNSDAAKTVNEWIDQAKPFFESNAAYVNPLSTLVGSYTVAHSVMELYEKPGVLSKVAATAKIAAGTAAIYLPTLNGEHDGQSIAVNCAFGTIGAGAALAVRFKEAQKELKAAS